MRWLSRVHNYLSTSVPSTFQNCPSDPAQFNQCCDPSQPRSTHGQKERVSLVSGCCGHPQGFGFSWHSEEHRRQANPKVSVRVAGLAVLLNTQLVVPWQWLILHQKSPQAAAWGGFHVSTTTYPQVCLPLSKTVLRSSKLPQLMPFLVSFPSWTRKLIQLDLAVFIVHSGSWFVVVCVCWIERAFNFNDLQLIWIWIWILFVLGQ